MAVIHEYPEHEYALHDVEVPHVPAPEELGRLAVAEVCETFSYSELAAINTYQLKIAPDARALIRYPFPAGFEESHKPDQLQKISANKSKYDGSTELHIRQDPAMATLRRLAQDFQARDRRIPPDVVRAARIRRTIVACMLRFTEPGDSTTVQ